LDLEAGNEPCYNAKMGQENIKGNVQIKSNNLILQLLIVSPPLCKIKALPLGRPTITKLRINLGINNID